MNGLRHLIERTPSILWLALVVADLVLTGLMWSAARRRVRRAGERVAHPEAVAGERDTALTVASLVPAGLFWGMVLAGSLHGLVAFGREVLRWHAGWEYLVPGTLDGVSVTFAFLAFRAVRRQKAPDRCQRVVWGAALASATVNFAYEYGHSGHNVVAGGYLGLLSLFGMVMFHEFLDQFEEGAAYVRRQNPKFGLRWITWPSNTFCAAVAWRNHPPAEGTAATVLTAVANLERVRALKATARDATVTGRHERELARLRRRAELTAAGAEPSDSTLDAPATGSVFDDGPSAPPSVATIPLPHAGSGPDREPGAGQVRVPATPAALVDWARTWVRMCADGHATSGPLGEHLARRYHLSSKQLRNIRHAATSGALRRRAAELGVPLPDGYVDHPGRGRVNGHTTAGAAPGGRRA
jgi:hypothetical protein